MIIYTIMSKTKLFIGADLRGPDLLATVDKVSAQLGQYFQVDVTDIKDAHIIIRVANNDYVQDVLDKQKLKSAVTLVTSPTPFKAGSQYYFNVDNAQKAVFGYIERSRARAHVMEASVRIRDENMRKGIYAPTDKYAFSEMREKYGLVRVRNFNVGVMEIATEDEIKLSGYLGSVPVVSISQEPILGVYYDLSAAKENKSYKIFLHPFEEIRMHVNSMYETHIYTHIDSAKTDVKFLASVIRLGVDQLNSYAACFNPVGMEIRSGLEKSLQKLSISSTY